MSTDNTAKAIHTGLWQQDNPLGLSLPPFEPLFSISTHPAWSSAEVPWAPWQLYTCRPEGPTMASVRLGTGTDCQPHQFSHTGLRYSGRDSKAGKWSHDADIRCCFHKLSWASASCCVGFDGGQRVQAKPGQQVQALSSQPSLQQLRGRWVATS